ncbi:MAG TPA: Asp-tRNA(Asn)/Glu-tRNA(Gln) amidotransferase subunit GatB [bacterium]|jgi:aspartyl-tRNA(Asn)/glutamyl-tRNA(Gln) amidotransferase subunit B|nr:Asp-tRNA(Asn)/Glu-tRNA(Gln) amidotransferase subunit GatB [bacterium]HOG37867.1 Asp-tRNA(Asn)/Glu-tRNA(Gln) amidotransferase subunit GatB [bacterium]HQI03084.1 Asp-tRNA(Asn)/Glu-tRNA(Gln) amidotransferase subunit GatB [bacterium]
MKLEPIIGLEIHTQLKTKSKMFCACSNTPDNTKPNSAVCPICLGHPGTLPSLNEQVVDCAIKLALALNLKINSNSVFERKNYFYPDLPSGYQISQFEYPLSENGFLVIEENDKKTKIGIERLHIENDSAKSMHVDGETLVDFNRAGTPLAEIVTNPDFRSPQQAKLFLQKLRQICRYLNVSDADMEKGNLRCDVNISMRPIGDTKLYPKTEIKNLNSFRSVEKAIEYEIKRQTELWEKDERPKIQTTRGYIDAKQITELQREKEESNDYRYFPEPDLNPLIVSKQKIQKLSIEIPELPDEKIKRFVSEYILTKNEAEVLSNTIEISSYFENTVSEFKTLISEKEYKKEKQKITKLINGWITSELFKLINKENMNISEIKITPYDFAKFISFIYKNTINSSNAQKVLKLMFDNGSDPEVIIKENDFSQINDESVLKQLAQKIIDNNKNQVEEYKSGKENLMKYFIGIAMKESKGKANPEIIENILKNKLK